MCGAELFPLKGIAGVVPMPYHDFDAHSGAGILRLDPRWIDPFIGVDNYTVRSNPFAPHPHAGMSAVSLTLPESEVGMVNRDTLGDHSLIAPGDLHWFQAGRGAVHEETLATVGKSTEGMQVFVNLSRAHKQSEPVGLRIKHQDMPVVAIDGGQVRVVAGEFAGQTSPITHDKRWLTQVNMLDITLASGASVDIPVKSGDNAFFVIRSGSVLVPNTAAAAEKIEESAIIFEASTTPGQSVARVTAGDQALRGVFFSGTPIGEPVVTGGPFTGNSQDDIMAYRRAFTRGEMGHLEASH